MTRMQRTTTKRKHKRGRNTQLFLISTDFNRGELYEVAGKDAREAIAIHLSEIDLAGVERVISGYSRRSSTCNAEQWEGFRCRVSPG